MTLTKENIAEWRSTLDVIIPYFDGEPYSKYYDDEELLYIFEGKSIEEVKKSYQDRFSYEFQL